VPAALGGATLLSKLHSAGSRDLGVGERNGLGQLLYLNRVAMAANLDGYAHMVGVAGASECDDPPITSDGLPEQPLYYQQCP
jgi:hypothetical protein